MLISLAGITMAQEKKYDFGFTLSVTKKPSEKYWSNDTSGSENYEIDKVVIPKNNYVALGLFVTHNIYKDYFLNYEMRIKHWGFKEIYLYPHFMTAPDQQPFIYTGLKTYVNTFDVSANVMRKINITSKIDLYPKAGLTVFRPISKGFDSTIYLSFGSDIEQNYNYVGPVYKLGYNVGIDGFYILSNKYSLKLSSTYYSPFNNTNNWIYAVRNTGSEYPWNKYRKKTSSLYFGVGVSKSVFKKKKE